MSSVVLTNSQELCDKMEAHVKGLQHYAFSIMIFNDREEVLLSQRAFAKYHSGGLWNKMNLLVKGNQKIPLNIISLLLRTISEYSIIDTSNE